MLSVRGHRPSRERVVLSHRAAPAEQRPEAGAAGTGPGNARSLVSPVFQRFRGGDGSER